jgi:hypothetical protein
LKRRGVLKEDSAANSRDLLLESHGSNLDEYVEDAEPREHRRRRHKRHHGNQQKNHLDNAEIRIDISVANCPDPVKFCSRSEAICATILQHFVPHFDVQYGVTFQVPIGLDRNGNTIAVDFLVDGVLFEYHPVRFFQSRKRFGDFSSREEYRSYARVFHSLTSEKRAFFHEAMRSRLTLNYFNRRRAILDQHPLFRRTELIVATSPEEFYERVIKRFGKGYPKTMERFLKLFEELMHTLPE